MTYVDLQAVIKSIGDSIVQRKCDRCGEDFPVFENRVEINCAVCREVSESAQRRESNLRNISPAEDAIPQFKGQRFSDPQPADRQKGHRQAHQYVRLWTGKLTGGKRTENAALVISGTTGTGKSQLLAMVSRALTDEGKDHALFRFRDLLDLILNTAFADRLTYTATVGDTVRKTILIDDLGTDYKPRKGENHEWSSAHLEIINALFEHLKNKRIPTMISTNLTIASMTKYLGERAVDRLREMGLLYRRLDYPSYRGKR